jgi:preprotein translocase subunit SecA
MHIQIQTGEPPPPLERAPIQMQAHHLNPLTGEDEMLPPDENAVQMRPVRTYDGPVDPNDPQTWGRVQRNAPCPCGSGRKFKHCHGALV